MKYFILLSLSLQLFGFEVQTIDETKEGKQKALELKKEKAELAKIYGNSEFTVAKDGKKIYSPISNVVTQKVVIIKPVLNIIKPKVTITKPTIKIIQASK